MSHPVDNQGPPEDRKKDKSRYKGPISHSGLSASLPLIVALLVGLLFVLYPNLGSHIESAFQSTVDYLNSAETTPGQQETSR